MSLQSLYLLDSCKLYIWFGLAAEGYRITDITLPFIISDVLYLIQSVHTLEIWLQLKNKYKVSVVTVSSQPAVSQANFENEISHIYPTSAGLKEVLSYFSFITSFKTLENW